MHYDEIATNDIDELFSWGSGWDCRYTQLSAGRLGFSCHRVSLPDMHIEWNTFGQAVLFEEVMHQPMLFLGVLLDSTGPAVYCGNEMSPYHGLLYPVGKEHEYRNCVGSRTMCIGVGGELWHTLNWNLSNQRVDVIPQRNFDSLVSVCEDVTAYAMACKETKVEPELELMLRDRIIVALRDTLAPWRLKIRESDSWQTNESSAFTLVKRAMQVMDTHDVGQKLNVPDLSAELSVSQRVIYDCFARCYGLGPYETHQLRKLHRFRSAILDGKPYHGKITQAALMAGFHHRGRLTQLYRRHFGETPRQTMQRRT